MHKACLIPLLLLLARAAPRREASLSRSIPPRRPGPTSPRAAPPGPCSSSAPPTRHPSAGLRGGPRRTRTPPSSALQLRDSTVFGESARAAEAPTHATREQPPFQARPAFSGPGSLYLHGASIPPQGGRARADLVSQGASDCLDTPFTTPERSQAEARYRDLCPEAGAAAVLRAGGARCRSSCRPRAGHRGVAPRPGRLRQRGVPRRRAAHRLETSTPALNVTNRVLGYHTLASHDAKLQGAGRPHASSSAGPASTRRPRRMRLPLASTQSCPDCVSAQNQTLFVRGDVGLAGLHQDAGGRLAAGMDGTLSAARLDEAAVSPALLFAAGAGAAGLVAVAAVGVFRVLALLFSRAPSLSSRRRTLLEAIGGEAGRDFLEPSGRPPASPSARCATTCGSRERRPHHRAEQGRKRRFLREPRPLRRRVAGPRPAARPRAPATARAAPNHPGASGAQVAGHAHTTWGWSPSTTLPPPRPPREGRPRGERNRPPAPAPCAA